MAVVVSDTSPIRALAHLGLLDLLRVLFDEVLIPPAVVDELGQGGRTSPPIAIGGLSYVHVQAPRDRTAVEGLLEILDRGEAEAIVLAQEVRAAAILMDEAAGRAIAQQQGLSPVGVLGVLLRGKQRSIVERVAPLMDRLQVELDFFISAELRSEVLRLAHE